MLYYKFKNSNSSIWFIYLGKIYISIRLVGQKVTSLIKNPSFSI